MHAAAKAIIGLIILLIGLAMFADEWGLHSFPGTIRWWSSFLTVLAGIVPILLILIGLFVLWLELDELGAKK